MSFLQRLFAGDALDHNDFWYYPVDSGDPSESGLIVTDSVAARNAAVWACRRVIAAGIASLPLHVYRRGAGNDRAQATDSPLYALLHDAPNDTQTALEFWEMQLGYQLMRGNSYALILAGRGGPVEQLVPVPPDYVTPLIVPGTRRLVYELRLPGAETVAVPASQMHHTRGLSLDGFTGVSVVTYARDTLGLALAQERYRARFFKNDARPGIAVSYPGEVDAEALDRIVAKLNAGHQGYQRAHRAIGLDQGAKIEVIGATSVDSQWLEGSNFSVTEVCRWFGVDPFEIYGSSGDSQTYANVEQRAIRHIQSCLRPWAVRNEQAINRDLLRPVDPAFYCEWSFDGLLRGDYLSRMQGNEIAIRSGVLSPNEARRRENMPSRPGGDEFTELNPQSPAPLPPAEDARDAQDGGTANDPSQ